MKQTKKSETYPMVHKDKENIFNIVQMEKNNFLIALGNEIVDGNKFKSKQEAQEHIDKKGWVLLLNVMCVVSKKVFENLKLKENGKAD